MQYPWIVIVGILAAAALYVLLPVMLSTFLGYRGRKAVTCPETGGPAEVGVDAARAAAGSAFGRLVLRAKSCSLWPARSGCAQRCLETSAEAPQEPHQARTR
jgi:hypothetical protein